MTQAYRIVNWKRIGEVTDKGRAAEADTPDEKIRKVRPKYARWQIEGHSLSPAQRRLSKKGYALGVMMEMACTGLYVRLFNLAGAWDDPKLRGWILDDRKRPMNPYQVADLFEIKDTDHIVAMFDLLCDPDVGLLEKAEFSGDAHTEGELGGKLGDVGEKGEEEEKPFLNVTETEGKEKLNNETERDITGVPDQGGVFGAPASALVTDSVSEVSGSGSDSAPRQGHRTEREIKTEAAKIICDIIGLKGLKPKTQSDSTTLQDIFEQLRYREMYETDEPLFEMALEKAKASCRFGDRPIRMFVAAMKKVPFCYVPVRRTVIRGAKDKYRR